MEIVSLILMAVGTLMYLIGGIWLLIVTFKVSLLWGLGSLFIPPLQFIFAILNWQVSKRPFMIALLGIVLASVGYAFAAKSVFEYEESSSSVVVDDESLHDDNN